MSRAGQIEVIEVEPVPAVALGRSTSGDRLARVVEQGIARVRAAVTAARVPTAGAPFVRFTDRADPIAVDIGIPLAGAHSVPTLRSTILPGGKAASRWHDGDVAGLVTALDEMQQDVGSDAAGHPWAWLWPGTAHDEPGIQLVWPLRSR